jgi:hypothetical protein
MEFTPEVKELLRNQKVLFENSRLDTDWINFITDCHLRGIDEEAFTELNLVNHESILKGEYSFDCTQLLFKGNVVAEKFTYGDWDDTFDEDMDWVDENKRKEIAKLLFDRFLDVNFV